jgi:hypothetical protein
MYFQFKLIVLSVLSSGMISNLNAENVSVKLEPVNIIGSVYSVDYDNNNRSTTVNTKRDAFDGNFSTFFASYDRIGTWLGLDLEGKYVITKVAYCPRVDQDSRLLLGLFEGANTPDFGDAVPLHLITSIPAYNRMTEAEVSCSRGFRYVRYVGPMGTGNDYSAGDGVRCNIAELAFYGYRSDGDDSHISPLTNIPAVVIHTANNQDIVSKETYIKGIVSFIPADGKNIYSDSLEIRGRGNASWNFPKKPYRLKLYSKANVLGNPAKEKNWTLINNFGDKTLMRNLLAFDLSKRLEMPYTSAGQPVNVFLNGDYKGCYQLCDQIEVANNRVEITKMKANDVSGTNLTGGYMIEIDAYAYQEISWFTSNQYQIPVTIKYPKDDEIVTQQYDYIKSYFEQMLTAINSSYYINPATGYRKYLDLGTFIRHFLVGEISGNTDTYWSVYMYKDRNSDKFFTGPVWDFDIAFENDNRTYPVNSKSEWVYASNGSSCAGNTRGMINRILSDISFMAELKSVYAKYRDNGTISDTALLDVIDNYANQLEQSQTLNFTRWNILNTKVHQNPRTYGSYAGEVNNVKNYIKNRISWIDRKLSYTYTPPSSIKENRFMSVSVTSCPNTIIIRGIAQPIKVDVLNTTGNLLYSQTIDKDCDISIKNGIYLIRLSNHREGDKVVKCIVH